MKRLLFFQKGKSIVLLLTLITALYFITPPSSGSHFDFLKNSRVGKKISHMNQVKGNVFVMGQASNGLTIVGLKKSSVFVSSILSDIENNEFVVSGSKKFSGVKKIRLSGQEVDAFFQPKLYAKKMMAFTSFSRAQQLLKKKEYFIVDEKPLGSSIVLQTLAFLVAFISSGYFVFLKSNLLKSLSQMGIENIRCEYLYLVLSAFLSISLNPLLFCFKFCLMFALFFVWHIILKQSVLLKTLRGGIFE